MTDTNEPTHVPAPKAPRKKRTVEERLADLKRRETEIRDREEARIMKRIEALDVEAHEILVVATSTDARNALIAIGRALVG